MNLKIRKKSISNSKKTISRFTLTGTLCQSSFPKIYKDSFPWNSWHPKIPNASITHTTFRTIELRQGHKTVLRVVLTTLRYVTHIAHRCVLKKLIWFEIFLRKSKILDVYTISFHTSVHWRKNSSHGKSRQSCEKRFIVVISVY